MFMAETKARMGSRTSGLSIQAMTHLIIIVCSGRQHSAEIAKCLGVFREKRCPARIRPNGAI
jgi:hypothetical protein